jgi:hypothetical protein|tara:strand:- start:2173 stop:2358 length:186 start_codon:yes stop_codon:yes gene_type:complete
MLYCSANKKLFGGGGVGGVGGVGVNGLVNGGVVYEKGVYMELIKYWGGDGFQSYLELSKSR